MHAAQNALMSANVTSQRHLDPVCNSSVCGRVRKAHHLAGRSECELDLMRCIPVSCAFKRCITRDLNSAGELSRPQTLLSRHVSPQSVQRNGVLRPSVKLTAPLIQSELEHSKKRNAFWLHTKTNVLYGMICCSFFFLSVTTMREK